MNQKDCYQTMARAEARAYKAVWGLRPPVGCPSGSQWAKPPEAEDILAFRMPVSYQIILKFIAACYAFDY